MHGPIIDTPMFDLHITHASPEAAFNNFLSRSYAFSRRLLTDGLTAVTSGNALERPLFDLCTHYRARSEVVIQ